MNKKIKTIFWLLVFLFIVIVSYFAIPFASGIKRALFIYIAILGGVFFLLGGLLFYYTIKLKIKGKLKLFLIFTGIAPMAVLISVLLHNLIYGLMIYVFGQDFWKGGDEAFFFTIALFVCPVVFLVGVIGSIIMFKKK